MHRTDAVVPLKKLRPPITLTKYRRLTAVDQSNNPVLLRLEVTRRSDLTARMLIVLAASKERTKATELAKRLERRSGSSLRSPLG